MGFDVGMTVYKPGMPHAPGIVTKVTDLAVWIKWGDDQSPMMYPLDSYEVRFRDMDREIERRASELHAWKLMQDRARRYR